MDNVNAVHNRVWSQWHWATLLLAVGLLVVSHLAGTSARAATTYQIGTFNIAGGHGMHGKKGNEVPDALAASIFDRKPAFVLLQEACADWTAQLVNQLTAKRRTDQQFPSYTAAFDAVAASQGGATATCQHPAPFGNAIVFREDTGLDKKTLKGHQLTCPSTGQQCPKEARGKEQREMLCIRAENPKTAACSIHLSLASDLRAEEAKEARRILDTEYRGYQLFAGGDLNSEPGSATAGQFYHKGYGLGADGALKEVDSPCNNDIKPLWFCRSGESSHGSRKIDYIFVSPGVKVASANVTTAKHSDHKPLWAEISS